eukprot:11045413-Prorocentrum_lima.AAC.1
MMMMMRRNNGKEALARNRTTHHQCTYHVQQQIMECQWIPFRKLHLCPPMLMKRAWVIQLTTP